MNPCADAGRANNPRLPMNCRKNLAIDPTSHSLAT